jgi:nucleotide-binding universal stress UspA family protein
MGNVGLTGILKIKILGSVSRNVLENAKCPVLIVH